ncbi:MAG: PAS domain S-box protein [Bacteroidales bacterium]
MGMTRKRETLIQYGSLGFVTAGFLLLAYQLIMMNLLELPLGFEGIRSLHSRFPLHFALDLLPLLAMVTGFWLGSRRHAELRELSDRSAHQREVDNEIRRITQSLTAGELSVRIREEILEPSVVQALKKLQQTLVRNREAEGVRRTEEKQRNWVSEGLAEFGDLLRTHAKDPADMGYAVVSALVSYLDANQGALFLKEEKEGRLLLNMVACHAYDRKKYPDRKVAWGSGLIGSVAMEKKGYYTDKIPDSYLQITSGLGKSNPRYLLIEPLVWNDQVYGILELASFKALDPHKLHFVSRVAENMATTLSTMESNLRTEALLRETQEQAGMLARKEEQVRQNMDVLEKTQEDAARQADTYISFTNTVNHTLMRAEYRTDGTLLYANTRFLKKLGYSGNREVEGKHINLFIHEKDQDWFNELWEKLSKGGRHFEGYMKHVSKMGQELWTMATYTCMRRDDGRVEKILFLAIDSTDQKKQSLEYEGQIAAIDKHTVKAVFLPDGHLRESNALFTDHLKYSGTELHHLKIFDLIAPGDQEVFGEIWDSVIKGDVFQGQLRILTRYEENRWFNATIMAVNDLYGEVEKVVCLGNDISKEKELESGSRRQLEEWVRKEEELRLTSIDLQARLRDLEDRRRKESNVQSKQNHRLIHVLDAMPFGLVVINNLGYLLQINPLAESLFSVRARDVISGKPTLLFGDENPSPLIRGFVEPTGNKPEGWHRNQTFHRADGKSVRADLLLLRSDLDDEITFSLLIFPNPRHENP